MRMPFAGPIGIGLLVTLGTAVAAVGQGPSSSPGEHQRAGNPLETSRWAVPSDNGGHVGYYVGGGCPHPRKAEGPTAEEGTWGWDYQGWFPLRRVALGWWHGRRYQGGTGAYQTDGPKLLPAVPETKAHE